MVKMIKMNLVVEKIIRLENVQNMEAVVQLTVYLHGRMKEIVLMASKCRS
jgi:hypothetical protein